MKRHALFLMAFLLLATACKRTRTKEQSLDKYSEYISVYPQKVVSVSPKFEFFLKKPTGATSVSSDVVSIKPTVAGKVSLKGNMLTFIPDKKLESNREYILTLHLSKLYNDIDKSLKDFTIKVKTKELLFSLYLQSPAMYNTNWYYVEGFFKVSDVLETAKLSKVITASYNGKSKHITFDTPESLASKVYFKIDSLQRFPKDKSLEISWNGNPLGSISEGNRRVIIVGKRNFKLLDVTVIGAAKKQIELTFSDPIKKSQDLKGLIQFLGLKNQKFTYKIASNIVTLYPTDLPKNEVDIEIFKGISNIQGYKLKENYIKTLYFKQPKPSVSFIKSGSILPKASNLKINFNAVNLRAVDITIYKIYKNNVLQFLQRNSLSNQNNLRYVGRPIAKQTVNLANRGLELGKQNAFAFNLSDMIAVENGAMYRVKISFKRAYSNYACDGVTPTNTIAYGKKEVNTKSFDRQNYYNWEDRENPCTDSYYIYNNGITTNILSTNLGVIVKKGDNDKIFVAVTDLTTTKSVRGARVQLLNLQQQPIISKSTDNQGIVMFKKASGAFFAVVSKNNTTTYVRLGDGNALSMSKFDVAGAKSKKGIKGYIYGERGVWRPGNQLFLTFVLNDAKNPIPKGHPIKFELLNPQGKIIKRKVFFKNANNLYSYAPSTNREAITGNWKLRVTVGGVVFNKTLKIETIKPNRLKIQLKSDSKRIKANMPITGKVSVAWLHGAIARGLKIDINGKFRQTKTMFSKFSKYNFDDITRRFKTEEFKVLKSKLNNEGKINFSVKPKLDNKAPGILKASFITKVYENGGDFSTDVFSQEVSPYKFYAGLMPAVESESENYLFTDKNYTFKVASVNEDGVGIAHNLEVKIYKSSWRWWWSTDERGLSNYDGTRYHEPYKTFQIKTKANGRGSFSFKVDKSDWGGYLIKVTDKKSKHSTSNLAYFDWPYWYGNKKGSKDQSNATMLVFTTDKKSYQVNQTATVKFPSAKGGRALISIENGTQVLNYFWVDTKAKQTTFSFPVLASYTPNVFVNISLLQRHSQTANDLPIRMYGVVPISVYDPTTKLEPEIQFADELKPESTATIRVREKHKKPMSYTIAIVDEGLLDLTRFKTPNPWETFYARQSLGVKTWDIYDDVIGAYGGKLNQILGIGGDASEAGSKNRKANRFKPMVIYLGPFHLKAGEVKDHKIKIPRYIGSVRAMLVATNAKTAAYGSDEKTAFVRKPLMILASLPRKITPQETVTLPVTVFAMKSKIKKVTITVQSDKSFTVVGGNQQTISFTQPDEKMAYFTLKVKDYKGIGKVKIVAVSGREKASYEVEMDILNPNPITTEVKSLVLKSNAKGKIVFTTFGTKGTNSASVELSTLPPMNFTKRMQDLIHYPYGCVEQTTSSAFPQLYLSAIFELSDQKKITIENNIKATILRLSNFQLSNGGLSYWQGNREANRWGTSYAGHFMMEAAKKGYVLPIGFKSKWLAYQRQTVRNWRYQSEDTDDALSQAYRLYTLSLANSPDLASMNRLRETAGISNQAKMRLASAYGLIGKKSIARSILSKLTSVSYKRRYYANYGSETRNKAMALETYALLGNQAKAIKLAQDIAKNLSRNWWMSTQTASYSLLAMAQYILQNGDSKGIKVNMTFNRDDSKKVISQKSVFTQNLNGIKKGNTLTIHNKNEGVLYVSVFNKGILPVGKEKVFQKNLQITAVYKTKDGSLINPNNLRQGTNFVGQVTLKNPTDRNIENVALTQFIPSGWEIVNTRFTDFGNSTTASPVDYTDIRDASIRNYFTLKKYETKTFRVLLNASYLGRYYLPGTQAEAMYDNDYIARTKGQWVRVVK